MPICRNDACKRKYHACSSCDLEPWEDKFCSEKCYLTSKEYIEYEELVKDFISQLSQEQKQIFLRILDQPDNLLDKALDWSYIAVKDNKIVENSKLVDQYLELVAEKAKIEQEMKRYLPVINRAEEDSQLWIRLTKGTGIATANSYRYVLKR